MGVFDKIKAPGWVRKKPTREAYVVTRADPGMTTIRGDDGRSVTRDAPPSPARGVRPDLGFDRERAAYVRARPELLRTMPGRFVVLVGEEMAGPFSTSRAAARAGWERFGPGPIFVKQVLWEEPIEHIGAVAATCRP